MREKRTLSVVAVAIAIVAVGLFWALRNRSEEPLNPVPKPTAAFIPVEFSCNKQDLLAQTAVLKTGQSFQLKGKCRSRSNESPKLEQVGFMMTVVDDREVFFQTATFKPQITGAVISFSCASTAPKDPGAYLIRAVLKNLGSGKTETLCEGKLRVEPGS